MRWRHEAPVESAITLAVAGLMKIVGAVLPFLIRHGLGSRTQVVLTALMWVAATGMLVWGTVNAVGAWLVIGGLFAMHDTAGTYGHAVLWDPLFVLWGIVLIIGLRRDGVERRSGFSGRTAS